jgi:hypothetical protein
LSHSSFLDISAYLETRFLTSEIESDVKNPAGVISSAIEPAEENRTLSCQGSVDTGPGAVHILERFLIITAIKEIISPGRWLLNSSFCGETKMVEQLRVMAAAPMTAAARPDQNRLGFFQL